MKKRYVYKMTDLGLSVFMALVAGYGIISGIRFGILSGGRPGTGFQPVFAGLILFVSSVCLFIKTIRDGKKRIDELQADAEKQKEHEEQQRLLEEDAAKNRRDTETWLGKTAAKLIPQAKLRWALIYLVGIWIIIFIIDKLGMYVGLWLMNFLFLKFISKYSWWQSLLIASAIAASFYLVFSLTLGINVPSFLNSLR